MISTADFRKQISKTLAPHLKALGFKGSGFNYIMDSDNFIFTIGLQANKWGGECCAEFGIQPKEIKGFGDHKIDFKKIKHYECEFRTRLATKSGSDQWWKYSDDEEANVQIVNQIVEIIVSKVLPIIELFKHEQFVFDRIEVADLRNIFKYVAEKLGGLYLMTSDIQFAWALTIIYENRNLNKSKQFAEFGLSKLDKTSKFRGKADFERVLRKDASS